MVKVGLRLSVQLTLIQILHKKIIARFLVWYEKSLERKIAVAEPDYFQGIFFFFFFFLIIWCCICWDNLHLKHLRLSHTIKTTGQFGPIQKKTTRHPPPIP